MNPDTQKYNDALTPADCDICNLPARERDEHLPEADNKIWHAHPAWFPDGNPEARYSNLYHCVRLLFWRGQSVDEPELANEGNFKTAEARYTAADQVNKQELARRRRPGTSKGLQEHRSPQGAAGSAGVQVAPLACLEALWQGTSPVALQSHTYVLNRRRNR